ADPFAQGSEEGVEAGIVADVGFEQQCVGQRFGELLQRGPEALTLVTESQLCARCGQRLGDGPSQRTLVGNPHDEALLAGQIDGVHGSPLCRSYLPRLGRQPSSIKRSNLSRAPPALLRSPRRSHVSASSEARRVG